MAEHSSTASSGVRRRRLAHLLVGALVGAALMAFSAVSGLAADKTIETAGSAGTYHWQPSTATVSSGGTVEFKNGSASVPHGVVWESPPETPSCPGVPSAGATSWSGTCTFSAGGTYNFHCPVHPLEMTGTITVTGGSPTPVATTGTASAISDSEETLNGTVNPNGVETSYYFEYGTSTAYGTKAPVSPESVGSGTVSVSKSVEISGLSPATTYHFRIVAVYETNKTKAGADQTFTTSGPPAATTSPATAVGGRKATLAGTVNARGHLTTYYFKYGTTTAYGQETTHKTTSGTISVSEPVTGLLPETTYHFKLVAENSSGAATPAPSDQQFTTFGKPLATTGQATAVTDVGATLGGTVNAEGQATTYHFNYGTTEAYGQETAAKPAGSGTSSVSQAVSITGLAAETTYHFQLVAENESGATEGVDRTFTTEATPPPPPPPPPAPPTTPPTVVPPPLPPPVVVLVPDTSITSKPRATTKDRTPTVKFAATTPGATYLCSVDNGAFRVCRSPFTTPSLKPGKHRIRVKAVAGGVADPTPASCSFKVLAAKRRR